MSTICDNKLCAYHCYLPDRKARVASVYVREDGEDVLVHRHLYRSRDNKHECFLCDVCREAVDMVVRSKP